MRTEGDLPLNHVEHWVAKLLDSLEADGLSPWTIRCYAFTARNFLRYLNARSVSIRDAEPQHIRSFLDLKRRQYVRNHGHPPVNEIWFRCDKTPPIHRLLTLAQGQWPPATHIDRRVLWFQKRLAKENVGSEVVRKQVAAVRRFLEFLSHRSMTLEDVTPADVTAFLTHRPKAYGCVHPSPAAGSGDWKKPHRYAVHRLLRYLRGQWPPPVTPDPEVEAYRQHLIAGGMIRKTTLDYCLHVRIFLDFLRSRGIRAEEVTPKHVEAFNRVAMRMYKKRRPNRLKSVRFWRMYSHRCVRSFLRFRQGEWPPDPTKPLVSMFESHLRRLQYSKGVVGRHAWVARAFLRYLEKEAVRIEEVRPAHVAGFLQLQHERFRKRNGRAPLHEPQWRTIFTSPVHLLLRMLNPDWPPTPPAATREERFHKEVCDGYARWLTDLKGLSAETLRKNGAAAKEFLEWLVRQSAVKNRAALRRLSIADIDEYLAWKLPGLRRATRVGACSCMRSFLRFLYSAGLLKGDLSVAVTSPSRYEFEEIPRAFSQDQIESMLACARRDTSPTGLRDFAMLLMLSTYGMRGGEVTRLRLDDIDWRMERIRVRQSKTGAETFLPLLDPVGEAIIRYLQHGRPASDCREIFLRIRVPRKPFTSTGSLGSVVRRRLKDAGIETTGRRGAHAFRFARAASLLRVSVPLKWIGDVLGHATESSTQTYLRLAVDDLRALSLELPGVKA